MLLNSHHVASEKNKHDDMCCHLAAEINTIPFKDQRNKVYIF